MHIFVIVSRLENLQKKKIQRVAPIPQMVLYLEGNILTSRIATKCPTALARPRYLVLQYTPIFK